MYNNLWCMHVCNYPSFLPSPDPPFPTTTTGVLQTRSSGKITTTQHKTICGSWIWLEDAKNNTVHRRELCIIIIIIADALAEDRTRSPEFSRNPNTNVATKKCAGRRACVRGRWCHSLSHKTRGCLISPLYPIYKSFQFSPFQKSFSFFFLVF